MHFRLLVDEQYNFKPERERELRKGEIENTHHLNDEK